LALHCLTALSWQKRAEGAQFRWHCPSAQVWPLAVQSMLLSMLKPSLPQLTTF